MSDDTILLKMTPDQARRLIRAASVYGRELASPSDDGTKADAHQLDQIRFDLEHALDKAQQQDQQDTTVD